MIVVNLFMLALMVLGIVIFFMGVRRVMSYMDNQEKTLKRIAKLLTPDEQDRR